MGEKSYFEEGMPGHYYSMAELEKIELDSTETIAEIMLGFLNTEPLKLVDGYIRDGFRGRMDELYRSLDTRLAECIQAKGEDDINYCREELLNTVDGLMNLCIKKGFETGCRVGGIQT